MTEVGRKQATVIVTVENAEGRKIEMDFEGTYPKVLYWLSQCGAYNEDVAKLLKE